MASWFGVVPTVPTVSGIVHLSKIGDVPFANSQFAGKAGSHVEAFTLQLNPPVPGLGIEYSCHQAQVGDTKWVANGELQGSRGQSRSIQGISVRLVGPTASQYQVNYTVAGIGSVSPGSNGAFLGTKGQDRGIEGFQVWLSAATVAMSGTAPGITGVAHVANVGDTALSTNVFVGGQTKTNHIEGLSIQLSPPSSDLGIEYGAHQAGVGDLPWQANGAFIGSRGQSRTLESVSIRLTGLRSSQYSVHYSGVVEGMGEQPAVSDGAPFGTKGQSRALCGLRVWITAKPVFVFPAPAVEGLVHRAQVGDVPFSASQFVGGKREGKQLEGFTLQLNPAVPDLGIEYTAHQEGTGDLPWVSGGTFIGSRGQSKRLEGIAVRLTGPQSQYFSVHYFTTVVGQTDTPPVSNGTFCGTKGQSRAIEGLQVWITAKPVYGVAPTTTGHYKPFAYQ